MATVVVVGGGQAGLSAGFHLQRRGFMSALDDPGAERTYVVLDAEPAPRDYVSAAAFAGMRVAIVGAGISALQQLSEISEVATTRWYSRRPPVFRDDELRGEANRVELVDHVAADVEAGRPVGSIVSYIGLAWTPYALAAQSRGALVRRPMFTAIEPDGVREADGEFAPLDGIVWATGFQPSLAHLDPLDPLGLRNELGGIQVSGTEVTAEPRVHLIGYGPSQSTVGANRAGRRAVTALVRRLGVA